MPGFPYWNSINISMEDLEGVSTPPLLFILTFKALVLLVRLHFVIKSVNINAINKIKTQNLEIFFFFFFCQWKKYTQGRFRSAMGAHCLHWTFVSQHYLIGIPPKIGGLANHFMFALSYEWARMEEKLTN